MTARWIAALAIGLLYAAAPVGRQADPIDREPTGAWSDEVDGLQARLSVMQAGTKFGVRWLIPILELRKNSDRADPMRVRLGGTVLQRHQLQVDLLDSNGAVVVDRGGPPHSGPEPMLGDINLPRKSWIRINLEWTGWGVSPGASAMVSTVNAARTFDSRENGQFLHPLYGS
jgi:hypothetical protein